MEYSGEQISESMIEIVKVEAEVDQQKQNFNLLDKGLSVRKVRRFKKAKDKFQDKERDYNL